MSRIPGKRGRVRQGQCPQGSRSPVGGQVGGQVTAVPDGSVAPKRLCELQSTCGGRGPLCWFGVGVRGRRGSRQPHREPGLTGTHPHRPSVTWSHALHPSRSRLPYFFFFKKNLCLRLAKHEKIQTWVWPGLRTRQPTLLGEDSKQGRWARSRATKPTWSPVTARWQRAGLGEGVPGPSSQRAGFAEALGRPGVRGRCSVAATPACHCFTTSGSFQGDHAVGGRSSAFPWNPRPESGVLTLLLTGSPVPHVCSARGWDRMSP